MKHIVASPILIIRSLLSLLSEAKNSPLIAPEIWTNSGKAVSPQVKMAPVIFIR